MAINIRKYVSIGSGGGTFNVAGFGELEGDNYWTGTNIFQRPVSVAAATDETHAVRLSQLDAFTNDIEETYATKTEVNNGLQGKLDVAGGTMSGALVLAADPVAPMEAATRQFVLSTTGGNVFTNTDNTFDEDKINTFAGPLIVRDALEDDEAANLGQLNSAITTALNPYAPLASPALSGVPTTPDPAVGNVNNSTIANTKFVTSQIATREPTLNPADTIPAAKFYRGDKTWSDRFDGGSLGIIGNSSGEAYKFGVTGTYATTSGQQMGEGVSVRFNMSPAYPSFFNGTGLVVIPNIAATSSSSAVLKGVFVRTDYDATFTGSVQGYIGVQVAAPTGAGVGTIAHNVWRGVQVDDISALNVAGSAAGFYSNLNTGANPRYNFYAAGSAANYFNGSVGIGAAPSTEKLQVAGNVAPATSTAHSLGTASLLWSEVYANNATINTSDARLKTPPRHMTDSEVLAFTEIAGLPMVWKWLERVENEGADLARLHSGPTVQAAIAIMTARNLDWTQYAAFCYDQWPELPEVKRTWPAQPEIRDGFGSIVQEAMSAGEEITQQYRPAGDRYSFRKEELLWWICRAMFVQQDRMRVRLERVEARLQIS